MLLGGGLVDKDVDQTHISCERAVEQKLVESEIGDGVPLNVFESMCISIMWQRGGSLLGER